MTTTTTAATLAVQFGLLRFASGWEVCPFWGAYQPRGDATTGAWVAAVRATGFRLFNAVDQADDETSTLFLFYWEADAAMLRHFFAAEEAAAATTTTHD